MYLTSLSLFPCLCVPNNDDFPTILIYVACFRARLKSDTIMLMVMLGYVKRNKMKVLWNKHMIGKQIKISIIIIIFLESKKYLGNIFIMGRLENNSPAKNFPYILY